MEALVQPGEIQEPVQAQVVEARVAHMPRLRQLQQVVPEEMGQLEDLTVMQLLVGPVVVWPVLQVLKELQT